MMSPRCALLISLVFVGVAVTQNSDVRFVDGDYPALCPPEKCECEHDSESLTLSCNVGTTNVRFSRVHSYTEITCEPGTTPDNVEINSLGFNDVTSADIRNCLLPSNFSLGHRVLRLWIKAAALHPLNTLSPSTFNGMTSLRNLTLDSCGLTELPVNLLNDNTYLTSLKLPANKLVTLPDGFFNSVPQLRELVITANQFDVLPSEISKLKSLKILDARNNNLKKVRREAFRGLHNLVELDLSGNCMEELDPDVFFDLVELQCIYLVKTCITVLPETLFTNNRNLNIIQLTDNPSLSVLPERLFSDQKSLTELRLQMCNISALPPHLLKNMYNLTSLDLSTNFVEMLDEFFLQDCVSLKTLKLDHNVLRDISEKAFLKNIALERLYLQFNELKYLPRQTFNSMNVLKYLDISNNMLVEIDSHFRRQDLLEDLNLSFNNVKTIDERTFEKCFNLHKLDLQNNSLSKSHFLLRQNVTNINLSYNNLNEMPVDWYDLPFLKTLDLSHNSIERIGLTFLQYKTAVTVNLEYNKIRYVNVGGETEKGSRPLIKLSHNPINCDCALDSLLNHMTNQMQQRKIMVDFDIENLLCEEPPDLIGRYIESLVSDDLSCQTFLNCPPACKCLFYVNETVGVDCHEKNLTLVPSDLPPGTFKLDLSGNSISTIRGLPYNTTNITTLIMSGNNLSFFEADVLPRSVKKLFLDSNNIQSLTESSMEYLNKVANLRLHLGHNPWYCDCENASLQQWVDDSGFIKDAVNMTCSNLDNEKVINYKCPEPEEENVVIIILCIVCVLAVLLASLFVAYYKYQHKLRVLLFSRGMCLTCIKESYIDSNKQFDAFVSFSQEDMEWVAKVLLPGLEQESPYYRLCIHHRDWMVGEWISDQIVRSVEASCRTIVVLSANFIESVWGRLEFKTAYHQALKDRMNRVILIVIGEIPSKESMDPDLRQYVEHNTYVCWGDPWFWQKLRYAMPHHPVSKYDRQLNSSSGWFTVIPSSPLSSYSSDSTSMSTSSV